MRAASGGRVAQLIHVLSSNITARLCAFLHDRRPLPVGLELGAHHAARVGGSGRLGRACVVRQSGYILEWSAICRQEQRRKRWILPAHRGLELAALRGGATL